MRRFILIIVGLFLYSCSNDEPVYYNQNGTTQQTEQHSVIGQILNGEHRIKDITEKDGVLTFMWETNDKEWVHTQLPITKVRYKYENVTYPYVKFKWESGYSTTSIDEIMNNYVIYAVIVTNETN